MTAKRLAWTLGCAALLVWATRGRGQATLSVSTESEPGPQLQPVQKPPTMLDRLKLPPNLPGAETPDIKMPPAGKPKEIDETIKKYFPPLPALGQEPRAQPGPAGLPLTLADLEQLALGHSPVRQQAAMDVEAARGAAVQAGLYPNPTVGYEGDTMAQGRTAGLQGGFIEQTIKTPGKLALARSAALMDVRIAEAKLRQTEIDILTKVRSGYFNVLVARKNLIVTRALAQLTDEIYNVLVLQLKAGEVATYEPMQVRVLALQTRALVVQAHNRYLAAWKDLAASLGLPGMPLTDLAGRLDAGVPAFRYDRLLAHVLAAHTEVAIAQEKVEKAQLVLRLAQIQPRPDLDFRVLLQRDNTTAPYGLTPSVAVGLPLPLWDRNQGNIQQAQALLAQAAEEGHRVRADLTSRLALAFERYQNNRTILEMYVREILPNQVQAFRAVVARHARGEAGDKGVSYNDLVTAEQTLVGVITNYVNVLRDQWTALVDLAGLLQTDDFSFLREAGQDLCVPDLESLMPLCCQHPCGPQVDPRWYGGDGFWPAPSGAFSKEMTAAPATREVSRPPSLPTGTSPRLWSVPTSNAITLPPLQRNP